MPSKPVVRSRKSRKPPLLPKAAPTPETDEHASERRGLSIFLQQTRAFRLALALYNDPVARDSEIRSLCEELAGQGIRVLTLDLREPPGDSRMLLARVEDLVKDAASTSERFVVMVVNLETRVDYNPELVRPGNPGAAFLETANLHRELFPEVGPYPLVIWMTELLERAFVGHAPDLWHWRSHVFDLRTLSVPSEAIVSADQNDWSSDDFRRHPEDRLRRLEEELAAYRRAGMLLAECHTLNAMGMARSDAGDHRLALRDFEQALTIANKVGFKAYMGAALMNLGNAHKNLGDTRKAIDFYEQRLTIAREIGERRGEGIALGNLGNAFLALGDVPKAIDFFQQRLAIAREIGERRGEGIALGNLGVAYAAQGDTRKAIDLYEQRLTIAREIGERRGEGMALGNLGIAYKKLGETSKAIDFFDQQLAIAREIGDRRGEGNALWNSALVFWELEERNGAMRRGVAALAIYQSIEAPVAEKVKATLEEWDRDKGAP